MMPAVNRGGRKAAIRKRPHRPEELFLPGSGSVQQDDPGRRSVARTDFRKMPGTRSPASDANVKRSAR